MTREYGPAEEARWRYAEATGECPDSGMSIAECWRSDICDCSMLPPQVCDLCGIATWSLMDHIDIRHPNRIRRIEHLGRED